MDPELSVPFAAMTSSSAFVMGLYLNFAMSMMILKTLVCWGRWTRRYDIYRLTVYDV